jgi:hypothetical protein
MGRSSRDQRLTINKRRNYPLVALPSKADRDATTDLRVQAVCDIGPGLATTSTLGGAGPLLVIVGGCDFSTISYWLLWFLHRKY